jgi:hypothetical protein
MRKQYLSIGGVCGLLIILGAVMFALTQQSVTTSALVPSVVPRGTGTAVPPPSPFHAPPTGPPATPNPAGQPMPGSPAIVPSIANAGPNVAAITVQDASAYVAGHPIYQAQGTPVTVTNVSFMTYRDANAQFHFGIYLAPDRLLCIVQVSGTFTVDGPLGYASTVSALAYEVFDAHTGNYLLLNIR